MEEVQEVFVRGQTYYSGKYLNYASLAVAKPEQWQIKHARSHTGMHTHVHIHIDPPPPSSQICLLLLSKPAVKSSIICIHHLHIATSPPPSFSSLLALTYFPPFLSHARAITPSLHEYSSSLSFFLPRKPRDHNSCT